MNWEDPARIESAYYSTSRQAGPYRLLQPVRGGVQDGSWEAVRLHPHRRACVRLLDIPRPQESWPYLFHDRVARLAALQHPGLGSVYESGNASERQIWVAAEPVEDPSLEQWLKQHPAPARLTGEQLNRRCGIALALGAALHRAHLSGLAHYRLSPAVVAISGGAAPEVRVVELGLSEWSGPQDDRLLDYRSPELASPAANADARADIYSVGVILHELLAGRRPEASPGAPQPIAGVPGAINEVIAKALAVEPERRFSSAAAMEEALRQALEPRTTHLLRRVGAATLVLVLVVAASWLASSQRRLRGDLAATTSLLKQEQEVISFLAEALAAPVTAAIPGKAELSKQIVADAVLRARRDHASEPRALVARLTALATAYGQMGDFRAALALDDESLEVMKAKMPQETPELADIHGQRAIYLYNLSKYPEAAQAARLASDIWRRLRPLDPESLASSLSSLGQAYGAMGRFAEANPPLWEAVSIYRDNKLENTHYLDSLRAYAMNLSRQGRWDEGLPLLREAAEKYLIKQGGTSYEYLLTLNDLGNTLALSGRLAEAAARQTDLVGVVRKVMGAESANLAISQLNLATTLIRLNSLERARAELAAGKEIFRKALGTEHPRYAEFLRAEGDIDSLSGKHEQAIATLRQALEHEHKTLPPGSLNAGFTLASLSVAQRRAGDSNSSAASKQAALGILQGKLPETHPVLQLMQDGR